MKPSIRKAILLNLVLVAAVCSILMSGCSDADNASVNAWGKKHRVTLFSGGKQIGQWTTSGKVENEGQSNGYYFQDDATKRVVRIDGDVIIEVVE